MFTLNGRRFNIHAPVEFNGIRYQNAHSPSLQAALGLLEVDEPLPPEGYSEDTHYKVELDEAPYVVYTEKAPSVIADTRWERIKAYRDQLTDLGGVYVASVDKWFHSDLKSKIQIMNLRSFGESLPQGINWKTMSGDFVLLTPALVDEIWMSHVPREIQIFAVAEAKRLDNTLVYEGWPAHYMPPESEFEEPEPEPEP